MAPKNGPPDRWMDYSPMGDRIPGTRFICMKVPLRPHLSRFVKDNDKFGCDTALKIVESKGHNLGLVIDLSFTTKYYDPKEFEEQNVQYKKIFVPGRVIPERKVMDSFSDVVLKFEDENPDNDKLIAVHCTHGLNRTGYMVCRHLVDKKNFKPEDAIAAFEKARGYKIERQIYRNDLLGVSTDVSSTREKSRSRSPRRRYQPEKDYNRDGPGYQEEMQNINDGYHDSAPFYHSNNNVIHHRRPWSDPYYLSSYNYQPYSHIHNYYTSYGYEPDRYHHRQTDERYYGKFEQYNHTDPYRWQSPNYRRSGNDKPYEQTCKTPSPYRARPPRGYNY